MYRANITVHDIHFDSKHKHNVSLNHPAASRSHTFIYTEHLLVSRIGHRYHHDKLLRKFNSYLSSLYFLWPYVTSTFHCASVVKYI
jgi:hypothetical protein